MAGAMEWLLLAYRMPREPSTPRITVWRKLARLRRITQRDYFPPPEREEARRAVESLTSEAAAR